MLCDFPLLRGSSFYSFFLVALGFFHWFLFGLGLFDALLEGSHDIYHWLFDFGHTNNFFSVDLSVDQFAQSVAIMILQIYLVESRGHGFDQADGKLQFIFVDFLLLELRNVLDFSNLAWIA